LERGGGEHLGCGWESQKEGEHKEGLGRVGRIILNKIILKWVREMGLGCMD
jgi:hypothetical protein